MLDYVTDYVTILPETKVIPMYLVCMCVCGGDVRVACIHVCVYMSVFRSVGRSVGP